MAGPVNIQQFAFHYSNNFNKDYESILERVNLLSTNFSKDDILPLIDEVSSLGSKLCAIDYIGTKLNNHEIKVSIFNQMYADYRFLLTKLYSKVLLLDLGDLELLKIFSDSTCFQNLKKEYDFEADLTIDHKIKDYVKTTSRQDFSNNANTQELYHENQNDFHSTDNLESCVDLKPIVSEILAKLESTLTQRNEELYSRLNQDLKDTILTNNSNSSQNSHLMEIVNALNENFDDQNLHFLDLPEHLKFNGDPSKLVRFLQHITNKVLVRLHRPCSQWESLMRNLTGSIFEYAQIFYLHYTDTKKAIFMFLNYLIDSFGQRYSIANSLISYSLERNLENPRNKMELLEYSTKLKIFICQMAYIGCSSFINNPVFLEQALSKIPIFIRDKWTKFTVENDVFTGKIFQYDENFNISYNMAKDKHPKYQENTLDEPSLVPCPNQKDEHQIFFNIKTYENWFTSHYMPFYGSDLESIYQGPNSQVMSKLFE